MQAQAKDLIRARHGRLFELIRQENLLVRRATVERLPSDRTLRAFRLAAGESLRPVPARSGYPS